MDNARSHAWFVGFAPYARVRRQIAFAVVVENAGYGGRVAAPLAGDIVSAAQGAGVVAVKITLRDVQTSFESWVVRLKQLLDPPLTADAQPLEIREGIVDAIEQRAVPAGGGQRVLAHNQISVTVLAPTHDDRLTLQAVLADLQDAVVSRLREIRCQIPAGFAVAVHYTRRARPGWTPEQRLAVEYQLARGCQAPMPVAPSSRRSARHGPSRPRMQAAYTLTESHVQIGRTALPVDSGGRPRRTTSRSSRTATNTATASDGPMRRSASSRRAANTACSTMAAATARASSATARRSRS